ncbi:MAG: hypothetical protein NWE98_09775 [Candidatus Bathyarchaeota archaeon]|nr:hypothetical protein [Candidatus Bathyarchaeota archaeon]
MESEEKPQLGICYECNIKDADSYQQPVYYCNLCEKWFCEKHSEPKFPYFVDWDTVFDVQGDPRIKASFYTEYKREGGHPDFAYLRKTIEALELEEKIRNKLIAQAIDKMVEADKQRRYEKRAREAKEREAKEKAEEAEIEKLHEKGKTLTISNRYDHMFVVPLDVYSNAEYAEYLNHAQTMKSVKVIVDEYYKKYGKRKKSEVPKKKHWWQKVVN